MKYRLDFSPRISLYSAPVTGAMVEPVVPLLFRAWQPSTWPTHSATFDETFIETLKQIFEESILGEINNVIEDVTRVNGDLQHRGHVIAIALMCALDAIASYGYRKHHVARFVEAHFPAEYKPFSEEIYTFYRLSLVHNWNLFEASIYPDTTGIAREGATIAFGLDFFGALVSATEHFLEHLASNPELQTKSLERYHGLRNLARP